MASETETDIEQLVVRANDILVYHRSKQQDTANALSHFLRTRGEVAQRQHYQRLLDQVDTAAKSMNAATAAALPLQSSLSNTSLISIISMMTTKLFRQYISRQKYYSAALLLARGLGIATASHLLYKKVGELLGKQFSDKQVFGLLFLIGAGVQLLYTFITYVKENDRSTHGFGSFLSSCKDSMIYSCLEKFLFFMCTEKYHLIGGFMVSNVCIEYIKSSIDRYKNGEGWFSIIFRSIGDTVVKTVDMGMKVIEGTCIMARQIIFLDVTDADMSIIHELKQQNVHVVQQVEGLDMAPAHEPFMCNIMGAAVRDPVWVKGYPYERSIIFEWINRTHPATGIRIPARNPKNIDEIITDGDVLEPTAEYMSLLGQYLALRLRTD